MSKAHVIRAVRQLDLHALRRVLDARPALLSVTDRQGRQLLHLACSVHCPTLGVADDTAVGVVDELLERGMALEHPVGRDACTPLFYAVATGRNPTLVAHLIARGARPASAPGGALFAAGWWDDVTSLDLLLRAGADIDVVVGVTPFLACWGWRRFAAAKLLATRGADVNWQDHKGRTALHHGVARRYDPSLLQWLVRRGASPDIRDRDGVSPSMAAARKRDKRWLLAMA